MAGKGIQIQSFKGSNDGVEDLKEYIENVKDDVEDQWGALEEEKIKGGSQDLVKFLGYYEVKQVDPDTHKVLAMKQAASLGQDKREGVEDYISRAEIILQRVPAVPAHSVLEEYDQQEDVSHIMCALPVDLTGAVSQPSKVVEQGAQLQETIEGRVSKAVAMKGKAKVVYWVDEEGEPN
ncbi:hypothetical protein FQN51_005002 [Onygenales sp. PD_10]|nr:hypothetical protein FQN51_005002 [Onygenales sp. PD_10]